LSPVARHITMLLEQDEGRAMTQDSFFTLDGEHYLARDPARGPWNPDHCHAGPVTAAIAREIERLFGPGKPLVRLTVELIRPVPTAGFAIAAEIARDGRRLATARAVLTGHDGRICANATATLTAPIDLQPPPTAPVRRWSLADARPTTFSFPGRPHDLRCFPDCVETRHPEGQDTAPGPTALWMRTPPLLADETPSAFQRLCPLADCSNAISRNAEATALTFLNTDLTIVMHRASNSDWLLSDAVSHWHGTGIGLAEARLHDEDGPVATAMQSLILQPI
jgi:hypothetical protein